MSASVASAVPTITTSASHSAPTAAAAFGSPPSASWISSERLIRRASEGSTTSNPRERNPRITWCSTGPSSTGLPSTVSRTRMATRGFPTAERRMDMAIRSSRSSDLDTTARTVTSQAPSGPWVCLTTSEDLTAPSVCVITRSFLTWKFSTSVWLVSTVPMPFSMAARFAERVAASKFAPYPVASTGMSWAPIRPANTRTGRSRNRHLTCAVP